MERFRSLHFCFSLKLRSRNGQIQMGPQNELTGLSWGLPIFPQTMGSLKHLAEPWCLQPGGMKPTLPVPGKAASPPIRLLKPGFSSTPAIVTPLSLWKWGPGLLCKFNSVWI